MDSTKIDFLFYSSEVAHELCLNDTESMHCVKVLRHKVGDKLYVTNGKGSIFYCSIIDANPKKCKVNILNELSEYQKPRKQIFVAISPTKNADRIEYFVEKAVEIGVSGIYFLKTNNTVAKRVNMERMEKISISAMKQSIKAYKTELYELESFEKFIQKTNLSEIKLIAHLTVDAEPIASIKNQNDMLVLIGPEGDFTTKELSLATKSGFKNVSLGPNRLRTETAALVALSILNLN